MREIQEHKIKIYEFPETGDEEENRLVRKIKVRCPPATTSPLWCSGIKTLFSFLKDKLPLAVVGSNTIIEVNSKKVRVRQYPWGVAEGISSPHYNWKHAEYMRYNLFDMNSSPL